MKTKKDTRTAEEKKKALRAALREAGLDSWSPAPEPASKPAPDLTPDPKDPAAGSKARDGDPPVRRR